MEPDRISQTQLCALLWAGLMAPAAELLPVVTLPQAGRGSGLSALLVLPVVLALGHILGTMGREGLAECTRRVLGPVLGRGVLLLYLLWGEFLLALRLRLCAQRLLTSGERDGSLCFFLLTMALLALWMARGKLAAFARAGQVFLAILLVTAGAVLGLTLFQCRPEHLLPLWWDDAGGIVRAVFPTLGTLGCGIFAAFLLDDMEPARHGRREWLVWTAGGCTLLAVEQAVVIGNLGPELAGRLNTPFFVLAKNVGVEGAFQRVESIVSALWTFADLVLLGILAFALWKIAGGISRRTTQKSAVTAAFLIGAALGLAVFPDGFAAEIAGRGIALWGNLFFGVAVPVLLFFINRFRKLQ